jgi:hypothetical protein
LAFLLLNLTSMARPEETDRDLVDLPFFPTAAIGAANIVYTERRKLCAKLDTPA